MIITDNLLNNLIRHLKSARMGGERATVLYALEATLATIPLDEVTRDRCEEAVDEILHHAKATGIESGFNCGGISALQSATAAIRALPVVPPRPMPTPEAVAQAFCCPSPSVRCGDRGPSLRTCSASNFHDGATAVLALFGKAAT